MASGTDRPKVDIDKQRVEDPNRTQDGTDPKIAPAEDANRTRTLHTLFGDGKEERIPNEIGGLTPFEEDHPIPPVTVIEPANNPATNLRMEDQIQDSETTREITPFKVESVIPPVTVGTPAGDKDQDPNRTREEIYFGGERVNPASASSQAEQSIPSYLPPQPRGEQATPGSDSRQKTAANILKRIDSRIKGLEKELLGQKVEKIRFLQTQGRQGIFDAQMMIIECLSERPRIPPRIEYRTFEVELIDSYIRGEDYQKAVDEAKKMIDDESRYLKSLQERIANLDSKAKIPADAQGEDIQKQDTIPASDYPSSNLVRRRQHLDNLISESNSFLQKYNDALKYAERRKDEKTRQGRTETYRKTETRIALQIDMDLRGDDDAGSIDEIIEGPPTLTG